jgi:hypothetical protein
MRDMFVLMLRYTSRTGLCLAVLAWLTTRSSEFSGHGSIGPAGFEANACPLGWVAVYYRSSVIGTEWAYYVHSALNCSTYKSELDKYWPVQNQPVLGVEYRQSTGGGTHLLLFRHWLICLIFLTATVATSWRRKKADVRETERVTGNGMSIDER